MCWVNHTWEGPVWGSCWVHLYPFLQVWHLHLLHLQSPGSSPLCPENTGYYFRTALKYTGWSSPDEQFRNDYPLFQKKYWTPENDKEWGTSIISYFLICKTLCWRLLDCKIWCNITNITEGHHKHLSSNAWLNIQTHCQDSLSILFNGTWPPPFNWLLGKQGLSLFCL